MQPSPLWMRDVIDEKRIFDELCSSRISQREQGSRCVLCKGSRMLCGKTSCPIMVKYYSRLRNRPLLDSLFLDGSSPPSVFIGRIGYPWVSVGPLIPPEHGDTSLLDTPEFWVGKSMEDIVDFRSQLVRGKVRVEVHNVEDGGRTVDLTRELAMATIPAEAEAEFERRPVGRIALDDEVQPFGPSAPLKKLDTANIKVDARIDKAYSDTDLKAADAVLSLYKDGTFVSKLQRAFSVGAFGLKKNRRFVPTRWSITAVDSILSSNLMKDVKTYPLINEFRLYESWQLDNRWEVILLPTSFQYELIEAWYPQTVWNPTGSSIVMMSDSEGFEGRTTYARIGGCYYAARLATNELLKAERRQAGICILREAHPGYIMPVGVWNVRENVRAALRTKPKKFSTLKELLFYVSTKLDIPVRRWLRNSSVLQDAMFQRKLGDYERDVEKLVERKEAVHIQEQ